MQTERAVSFRVVAPAALIGYACLVATGITWWVLNLGAVPEYGDTTHYLQLAATLRVDQHRTLFYPLVLRGLRGIATGLGVQTHLLVYLLQSAAVLLSIAYLGRALWDVTATTARFSCLATVSAGCRCLMIGTAAVVVFTEPLVNHFALSVMSDSLAASFMVVGIATLVRVTVLGDTRLRTAIVGWLAVAAAGFMRAERVILFVVIIAGILTIHAFQVRWMRSAGSTRLSGPGLRPLTLLAVLLITPTAAVIVLNHATQTAEGWPPRTVGMHLFVRTVYPRLAAMRPLLSAEAQAVVSAEDAARFDSNYNHYLSLIPRLRRGAGGTDRLVDEISRAALQNRGPDIARAIALDALCYSIPIIAYPVDVILDTQRNVSTWTASRMEMAHPFLTWVYFVTATTVLVGVQLPLLLAEPYRRGDRDRHVTVAVALTVGGAVVSGVGYAIGSGLQNVRYALPGYMLLYAVIVWSNAATLAMHGAGRPLQRIAQGFSRWMNNASV
jgi:hypothetical protein